MNNLNANYERILEALKKVSNENHLFRYIPCGIKSKIEPSVYNRRKRRLVDKINEIRLKLTKSFNEFEKFFIVDSMPLEVCKLSRSNTSKICKESEYCYPKRFLCLSTNAFLRL